MRLVTTPELVKIVEAVDFKLIMHIGELLLAGLAGHIDLPELGAALPAGRDP